MMKPAPYPQSLAQRAINLLRQYLATADAGPRGKKGGPPLWTIDAQTRKLLAEVDAFNTREANRR